MRLAARIAFFVAFGGVISCGKFLGLAEDEPGSDGGGVDPDEGGAIDGAQGSNDGTTNDGSASDADPTLDGGGDAGVGDGSGDATGSKPFRIVFISRRDVSGDMQFAGSPTSGVKGADDECNADALDAGLSGSFVAWLSAPGKAAIGKVNQTTPYRRPDNQELWTSTINVGYPANPIDRTSTNVQRTNVFVWTGTNANAGTYDAAANHCSGWGSAINPQTGQVGSSSASNQPNWTQGGMRFCDQPLAIYCFEQ